MSLRPWRALRTLLRGPGVGWLVVLLLHWTLAAAVGGALGLGLRFVGLGPLFLYAAGAYTRGVEQRDEAPPLVWPRDWTGLVLWPAFGLSLLLLLLWLPGILMLVSGALEAMARAELYGGRAWDHVVVRPREWIVAGACTLLALAYWPLAVVRVATTGHAFGGFDAYEIFGQMKDLGWRYAALAALALPVVWVFVVLLLLGGPLWTAAWAIGPFGLSVLTGVQSHQLGRWEAETAET